MKAKVRATFKRMQEGNSSDYEVIEQAEAEFNRGLPSRILEAVRGLEGHGLGGYPISRFEHSLQSASRALRDGKEEDYVVAALIHDVGDPLAPYSHGSYSAAIIRPFVSERLAWIVEHHPVFQMYYYGPYMNGVNDARERYRGHKWFDDTAEFCEKYDENCFDSDYISYPLDKFAPMIVSVFTREPRIA